MIGNVYKESVLNFPMVEKKEEKTNKSQVKHDFSMLSYGLGLASLATALFLSPAAIILGIMGVIHAQKTTNPSFKKSDKVECRGFDSGNYNIRCQYDFLNHKSPVFITTCPIKMFSKKRGAMEMSVGTIVTIVLLMTVLVLGIFLVQRIFTSSTECH